MLTILTLRLLATLLASVSSEPQPQTFIQHCVQSQCVQVNNVNNPNNMGSAPTGYSGNTIKNNQIATIANWGPEYRVAVDIMVHSAGSTGVYGYSNILHFTAGADDWLSKLGERVPAIYYYRNPESVFHICTTVGTNGNSCFNYDIEFNKEYHIEIVQANKNGKFYYTVNINGEEIKNVENTNPQSFEDVKVFAGDNFFPASVATYKNLVWETGCQTGWSGFLGQCYKYFPEEKTWEEAHNICQSNTAELVSINSAEENEFVAGLSAAPRLWIGGRTDCRDCNFYWTDGTPWDFENWIPGEPLYDGNFVEMWPNEDGKWNDRQSDIDGLDRPFACKKVQGA